MPGPRIGFEPLPAGHRREAQAVLRDARHLRLEALERRKVVLAERDQDPVVAAREVEALGRGIVGLEARFELPRRAILDQVGEVLDEARRARAPGLVGLGEGEDLLELVEDQQRDERAARFVAQHIVAVVQELPERLAGGRDARLGPLAGMTCGLQDRLLDLLAGLRRVGGVGDAHVDRAIALAAQARHQAGAQDRSLAEPRLAEQHGEELALHATRELGDLLVAAEEESPRVLGERGEAEPGMAIVDRLGTRYPGLRVHDGRARVKSCRRAANSGVTAPPGNCVKCNALKRSGTSASAALVSSMVTGSTNSAPSAMLRARSIA